MCRKIWVIQGFYRSKGFEAMKAGKSAIWPLPRIPSDHGRTVLLGKMLNSFVSPDLKLHSRYCHNSSIIHPFQNSMRVDVTHLRR